MSRILLAVSGGIDSMYLLARSAEIFPGCEVAVAHCNFRLRGEESDADEEFVRARCLERGIPFFCQRFETEQYAHEHGVSIEMAARDLRYGWFASLIAQEHFDAVAVAHNAGDNAETLILNLLRGTGSRGLRGMEERDIAGIGSGRVLRPLLNVSREEICAWMEEHGIPHREDRTNAETLYKRNKIRHEVFPVFAEINPSFLRTLGSDMRHFAQVDDIAEDYFRSTAMSVEVPGEPRALSIPALMALKHWEYMLWRLLEPYGFDEGTLDSLRNLLLGDGTVSGKTFEAPQWKAVTSSDRIIILPRKEGCSGDGELSLPGPGEYEFKGVRLAVNVFDRPTDLQLQQPEGQLIADASKLPFPLHLRGWRDGDWMRPLGLGGRKKLSDLFVDLKWSLPQKEKAVVLSHPDGEEGHAGALLCTRIDDSLKVSGKTLKILEIKLL